MSTLKWTKRGHPLRVKLHQPSQIHFHAVLKEKRLVRFPNILENMPQFFWEVWQSHLLLFLQVVPDNHYCLLILKFLYYLICYDFNGIQKKFFEMISFDKCFWKVLFYWHNNTQKLQRQKLPKKNKVTNTFAVKFILHVVHCTKLKPQWTRIRIQKVWFVIFFTPWPD